MHVIKTVNHSKGKYTFNLPLKVVDESASRELEQIEGTGSVSRIFQLFCRN